MPPTLDGSEVLGGGLGNWGRVSARGRGRLDCFTCSTGVSLQDVIPNVRQLVLPSYLLNDGSFAHMNMASFMFLKDLVFPGV